jgi:hypothetical protein
MVREERERERERERESARQTFSDTTNRSRHETWLGRSI